MRQTGTSLAEDLEAQESWAADQGFDPCQPWDATEQQAATLAWPSYRRLHLVYTLVVFVLIATGLPIQLPDLRAQLIGGYGRLIATVHEWVGLAMLLLPVAAFAVAPRRALEIIHVRAYRRDSLHLHGLNLWFTLISGAVFIVTGFLLWYQAHLPDSVLDLSVKLHRVFSYALYVMIPLHLIASRRRIVTALLGWSSWLRAAPARRGRFQEPEAKTEDLPCC